MFDDLPPLRAGWRRTLWWLRPGLFLVGLLVGGLYLASINMGAMHGEALGTVSSQALTNALRAYQTEYGHWPDFTGDGLFLDEARQARLLRVLTGKDEVNNPRKIVLFEGTDASGTPGHYRSGFSPETGAFLDPWGQPYRIALDAHDDYSIPSPYPDDGPIQMHVIVWSLGKDGQQGAPANPRTAKGSDDVMSWQ